MLFQSLVLAAATFLATLARADYDIDPESVDISLRGTFAIPCSLENIPSSNSGRKLVYHGQGDLPPYLHAI
jgi:hypothetical protein